MRHDCVFCQIVLGDAPSHGVWEDERHIAFLWIFPNTEGATVVATKRHRPSYVAELPPNEYLDLHRAVQQVARLLDAAFADVGRTGIVYEGFGVDHAHAKLFPMHGTADAQGPQWRRVTSTRDGFFDRYEGYLSSHDHLRADDEWLSRIAARIRGAADA